MLSPNGSSGTCIPDGVYYIPMPCLHGATMPPVRPVRETFASYGSRQRDIMGQVHFASSMVHSPWTALRVRWVPVYCLSGRNTARAAVGGEVPTRTLSVCTAGT